MTADSTYRTSDHSMFNLEDGRCVLWLVEDISFCEVQPEHVELLRVFKEPQSLEDGVASLDISRRDALREKAMELIELGVLKDVPPIQLKLSDELVPTIDAFRVVLTEACNFRCPGCFSTTALRNSRQKLKTMTDDVIEKVFESIVRYGRDNSVLVQFFGGEPLLRFDQMKRATQILMNAVERGEMQLPTLTLTTNGYLITDEVVEFFARYNFQVGISIEGSEELHNQIRKTATGLATFDTVAANYDKLVRAGVDTHVLFTPYPDSQHRMVETLKYLLNRFPSHRITINTAFDESTLGWLVIDEYAEQLMECEVFAHARNIEIDSALSPILFAISSRESRLSPQATLGGRVMVTVDTEGNASRSSQKWEPYLLLGDLEEARSKTFPILRDEQCQGCVARFVCGGPNEEYQHATGQSRDPEKCNFHVKALSAIANNIRIFEEAGEPCDPGTVEPAACV